MIRVGIIAGTVVAVLAALVWGAAIVRRAEQAKIANQTIEEMKKRDKDDADFKKLDMAGVCRELDLDLLPDGSGCQ